MTLTVGIDVGTTTITALALDPDFGEVVAVASAANDAEITSPADKARGRSEWDSRRMTAISHKVLRTLADDLGERRSAIAGICVTGQQHGVVLLDEHLEPLTPFINWQDRRAEDKLADTARSCLAHARAAVGDDAPARTGCRLAAGFLASTLFWLKEAGRLPAAGTACFAADMVAAQLTGARPVTDPTNGASSGVLNLQRRTWDGEAIHALGLPASLFPEIRESGDALGALTPAAASATGLRAGIPVYVGLGDNQASFLGSVAEPDATVLVNVGTGAQVGRYTDSFCAAPPLELRPFPRGGYLLVHAGLSGGRSYAALEQFFRRVGADLFGTDDADKLYGAMNELSASAPAGSDGLRCDPCFAGTRTDPARRAVWTGMSTENFTPAHMIRALLEGMARAFREGYDGIAAATGSLCSRLVGSGNGLRENAVLASIVAAEFAMPLAVPVHREEAAYGAALVAACGATIFPDLRSAARLIRYERMV